MYVNETQKLQLPLEYKVVFVVVVVDFVNSNENG